MRTPVEPAFDGSVNCADWSAPGGTAIMGDADQSHAWMLAGQGNACTGHVYCFEQ